MTNKRYILERHIEDALSWVLILYFLCYAMFSLYEKHYIFNYILVFLSGIWVGCKITKWMYRRMNPKSNLWKEVPRN